MKAILTAIVGLILVYPAVLVSGALGDFANSYFTLDTYGNLFVRSIPFLAIIAGMWGVFRAISGLGGKSGE